MLLDLLFHHHYDPVVGGYSKKQDSTGNTEKGLQVQPLAPRIVAGRRTTTTAVTQNWDKVLQDILSPSEEVASEVRNDPDRLASDTVPTTAVVKSSLQKALKNTQTAVEQLSDPAPSAVEMVVKRRRDDEEALLLALAELL